MLEKQRQDQYTKFKDSLFGHDHTNTDQISVSDPALDPDLDLILDRSRSFINKIKEHQHEKIKTKQINKFKRLYYKRHGCHHNLNRHNHCFDNTNHNSSSLSGQPNVPSSISPRSSTTSIISNVPATPITLFPIIIHIGKYMHPLQTPLSPYLHLDLQQCHLGKFSL